MSREASCVFIRPPEDPGTYRKSEEINAVRPKISEKNVCVFLFCILPFTSAHKLTTLANIL